MRFKGSKKFRNGTKGPRQGDGEWKHSPIRCKRPYRKHGGGKNLHQGHNWGLTELSSGAMMEGRKPPSRALG